MNAKEAIKILKEDRYLYESDIVYPGDGSPDGALLLAIDIAIESLEKQIPKKVILGDDEQDYVLCPVCKIELAMMDTWREYESRVYKYCANCGQAIDWSDTE